MADSKPGTRGVRRLRSVLKLVDGGAESPQESRVRMLFMRHSDIRLTMQTYDDSTLYELDAAVKALDKLGLQ